MDYPNQYLSSWYVYAKHGILLVFAWIFPIVFVCAQVFEANIDASEQLEGASFEVKFTLRDALEKQFIKPVSAEGLKYVKSETETAAGMVNGQVYRQKTWTLTYQAAKPGTYFIGAASVALDDGKKVSTKPIQIKVVPLKVTTKVTPPPGSKDIFIAAVMDRPFAYIGEQITWQLKIYTQVNFDGADLVEMPSFEGFFGREKKRFDNRVTYETIQGKKYAVKVLDEEAIFPQQTGELVIGSAKVRVALEDQGQFFSRTRPVSLQSLPTKITIKPLPDPVPEDFSGGVGQYTAEFTLDRDTLSTDDAITLKIAIKGNGDSRRFAMPALKLPPGLEAYEPRIIAEEEYESITAMLHTRTVEYIILPKTPGIYPFRPSLVYFDPDSNVYKVILSDVEDTLVITPGPNYVPPVDSGAVIANPSQTAITGGANQPWYIWLQRVKWGYIAGGLGALFLSFGIWRLLRRYFRNTRAAHVYAMPKMTAQKPVPQPIRKEQEPKTVLATDAPTIHLQTLNDARHLMATHQSVAFFQTIFGGLKKYLTAKTGLEMADLNPDSIKRSLAEKNIPGVHIQMILSVWQFCEMALYAGQTSQTQMEKTLEYTQIALENLEKDTAK